MGNCKYCGKELLKKNRRFCNNSCSAKYSYRNCNFLEKRKKTMLERYGVEYATQSKELQDKTKQTCIAKYGVEYALQSEEVKGKGIQTNIEKYGVKHASQSTEVQEKQKQTCLERYGVDHPWKSTDVQEKAKQTWISKYGVDNPWKSEQIKEKIKGICLERYGVEYGMQFKEIRDKCSTTNHGKFFNHLLNSDRLQGLVEPLFSLDEYKGVSNKYNWKCKKCGGEFVCRIDDGKIPRCLVCFPYNSLWKSHYEEEIVDWLQSLGISNVVRNDRVILNGYEIDIYLHENKLGIEFNGLWSHSEISGSKSKEYHLDKTTKCTEQGIQLVHIFEDEWISKQDIVKSILLSKLNLIHSRIYARECTIQIVPNIDAKLFLFDNHLQEPVNCKYFFGLYHESTLVYLIGLSKPRYNKEYEYELVRSCPLINTLVLGGFSKLIKHVIQALNIHSMISYVDRRYFTGTGYKDWTLIHSTSPNYYYTKDGSRESRIKYQKHKIIEHESDKNLTEWQIMQLKGYDRVYDCGNLVYEYKGV